MIQTTSAFLMSVQELVIAPRPNVGPKLDTVGPCQILAWFSSCNIPRPRVTFQVNQPVSFVHELPDRKAMVVQRLTVTPSLFFSMKFASRSSFISRAMRSNAKSQVTRSKLLVPGLRYIGCFTRVSARM